MLAVLALTLALAPAPAHLSIEPWKGADLQPLTGAAAKYRLTVTGAPNAVVHLRAGHLAQGWLAAFCTARLCQPMRADITLPASGRASLQFELIRESDTAAKRSGAQITGDGGESVSIPVSR